MSELFIVTQDLSILNVSKIQSINLLSAVMENDVTGEMIEVIEIAAVMEFGDDDTPTPLGYYVSEENAFLTMEKLIAWLSEKNEYNRVFRMPDIDIHEEDSEPSEENENNNTELDYSLPKESES